MNVAMQLLLPNSQRRVDTYMCMLQTTYLEACMAILQPEQLTITIVPDKYHSNSASS